MFRFCCFAVESLCGVTSLWFTELEPTPAHSLTFAMAGGKPSEVQGRIELQDVKFAYPERPGVMVFQSFNLVVEPGMTVALCGQSGSGKSSIVALVLRFYDPLEGKVGHTVATTRPPPTSADTSVGALQMQMLASGMEGANNEGLLAQSLHSHQT